MSADPRPKLMPRAAFLRRAALFGLFAAGFLAVALGAGIAGYRFFGHLSWVDAFLNAAMILTGMGPVDPMPDDGAKIFASLYALFSGAVYPVITAIVLYPFVHRMLRALHLEFLDSDDDKAP
ncbi:MAG: hypothetical protein H6895_08210 [Defluviimonas sp.]|uniref:hypothetical protein n=1 Tax=Albidovulum sp. TaxID=1872424 RepID=UPI001DD7F3C5|nr:hypothetical protein [Paracoccaceae bacterium]MCC0064055.1 hypothetical protein [Defluviimonas sp.]